MEYYNSNLYLYVGNNSPTKTMLGLVTTIAHEKENHNNTIYNREHSKQNFWPCKVTKNYTQFFVGSSSPRKKCFDNCSIVHAFENIQQ